MESPIYAALASSQLVREYTEQFHKLTGAALRLTPASGELKRGTFGRRGNLFCDLLNKAAGGSPVCQKTQAELQKRLDSKLAPQHICCPVKLTDLAVPVVFEGKHVATLSGGQVLRQAPTRRDFERTASVLVDGGISPDDLPKLRKAYFQTRVIADDQFRAMLRLLVLFAENLAESANRCLLAAHGEEAVAVTQAKEWVRRHPAEPITMRAMAQRVHLSPSYFCRLFSKDGGLRFTEYVCRVRVEYAKHLLLPGAGRVGDVAMNSGFGDISYFNRMFKKCVGVTPTEYRHGRGWRPRRSVVLGHVGGTGDSIQKAPIPRTSLMYKQARQ
jgi:AraC-like DNA-binding protein/ligand-binding sensor protein